MFKSMNKPEQDLILMRKTHTSPSRFCAWLDNPSRFLSTYFFKKKTEPTPAILTGRLIHECLPILIRKIKGFEDEVKIIQRPDFSGRGKSEKIKAFEEENEGNIIASKEQMLSIDALDIELNFKHKKNILEGKVYFEVPIFAKGLQGHVDMIIDRDGVLTPYELKTMSLIGGYISDSIKYQKKRKFMIQEIFYMKTLKELMNSDMDYLNYELNKLHWIMVQTNEFYSSHSMTSSNALFSAYSTYVENKLNDYNDFVDAINSKFGDAWVLNSTYEGDYKEDMIKLKQILKLDPLSIMGYDKRDSFVMV